MFALFACSEKSNKGNEKYDKHSLENDNSFVNKNNTQKQNNEPILNPDIKVNITLDSLLLFDSETQLRECFGSNVKSSKGYYPEGMGEYNNTLLFPNTKNEVEFVWHDDSLKFNKLMYIKLSGKNTDWKTKEGITIGTAIKELELLNKRPFTFFGFEWDYAGAINWNNGYLSKRNISGNLVFYNNEIPEYFEDLIGDHEIESSSEIAQKTKLILGEIIMKRKK